MLFPSGPKLDDNPWHDAGGFDSPFVTFVLGLALPIVCVMLSVWAVVSGGVTIPDIKRWMAGFPSPRFEGPAAVWTFVAFSLGVGLILVAHYFLANVFRESYRNQYVAVAGIALAFAGLTGFVIGALV